MSLLFRNGKNCIMGNLAEVNGLPFNMCVDVEFLDGTGMSQG